MYLTAQRVVAPRTKKQGVNSFLHTHGRNWSARHPGAIPDPDKNPGKLERREVVVRPPRGNRVLSYIDIVAPDHVMDAELLRRLKAFLKHAQKHPMPWNGTEGPCRFRIWMDPGLAQEWLREVAILWDAARSLWKSTA